MACHVRKEHQKLSVIVTRVHLIILIILNNQSKAVGTRPATSAKSIKSNLYPQKRVSKKSRDVACHVRKEYQKLLVVSCPSYHSNPINLSNPKKKILNHSLLLTILWRRSILILKKLAILTAKNNKNNTININNS